MGIFKALSASMHGISQNQFKELYYCNSMPNDVLMVKATKRTNNRSVKTVNDNIIPDGSVVIVNDGQCAIFVSSGKVVDVCMELGEHEINNPEAPSVMNGSGLKSVFKEVGRRFTYGGDAPAQDHRIYYINTKEIMAVNFSFDSIARFLSLSGSNGCHYDASVKSQGSLSYHIVKPEIAYKKLIGDAMHTFKSEYFNRQIAAAVEQYLRKFLTEISKRQENDLNLAVPVVEQEAQESTVQYLLDNFGIEIITINITSNQMSGMDRANAKNMAVHGSLFNAVSVPDATADDGQKSVPQPMSTEWKCTCGNVNHSRFCPECGKWRCDCGAVNSGNFCGECGSGKLKTATDNEQDV